MKAMLGMLAAASLALPMAAGAQSYGGHMSSAGGAHAAAGAVGHAGGGYHASGGFRGGGYPASGGFRMNQGGHGGRNYAFGDDRFRSRGFDGGHRFGERGFDRNFRDEDRFRDRDHDRDRFAFGIYAYPGYYGGYDYDYPYVDYGYAPYDYGDNGYYDDQAYADDGYAQPYQSAPPYEYDEDQAYGPAYVQGYDQAYGPGYGGYEESYGYEDQAPLTGGYDWSVGAPADCGQWVWRSEWNRYQWVPADCRCPDWEGAREPRG